MSWIKRRGQGASSNPSSAPPVQMYNPNQHSNLQNQWQQQDLQPPQTNNWYNQTQTSNQQQHGGSAFSQTNYPSQQNYWMQNFNQQQTTTQAPYDYNQHYSQYEQNHQDYNTQNNQTYHRNTPTTNHVEPTTQPHADTMNWGWGDEDNNVQNLPLQNTNSNQNQAAFDAFGGDDRWDWSVEDSNTNSNTKENLDIVENRQEVIFQKMGKLAEKQAVVQPVRREELKDVGYGNLSLNQLPLLKPKTKSDTLTPQWSTESQVSQDSSDVLHTSESDKSHMLSRSSTISESPTSAGHEVNPELNQQELKQDELQSSSYYRQENYSIQHENKEVLSSVQDDQPKMLRPTPPPPILKNQTPPLLPPPSSSGDDTTNMYKRVGPLSHKTATKYSTIDNQQQQSFYPSQPTYYPPNLNNPFTQSANLETLPDNSEQPDSLPQPNQLSKKVSSKTIQQWPENNEIAPINDRNQYLETGHLSNDYDQSLTVENTDLQPPPSFPRMVLGQIEQSDGNVQDEPPPGLSRMVLGETVANEPPVGLHRMVPGESSSPKVQSVVRPPQSYSRDGNNSDSSTNQLRSTIINRSETIGADLPPNADNGSTPPAYNNNVRETNADGANNLDETSNPPVIDRRDSIEGEPQDTNVMSNLASSVRSLTIGDTIVDSVVTNQSERQSRKLSRQESTDSEKEVETRSHRKLSKDRSERRFIDKHDRYDRDGKNRRRYTPSPDDYRKKYDRRKYNKEKQYEDDTDYYSDKAGSRKRDERERLDSYDRKYSSLKRDKDKDRGKREHRRDYGGRDSRRTDYYNRYGGEYDDQTRPSSRSDSMHDSYRQDRDRHRDRDRDRQRRNRDPYNSSYMQQGYGYDPYHPYYQQYHYYENLRRSNPQAYAEWYRKYYQQSSMQQSYGPEERASVHSGRSSANGKLPEDRYTRQSYYSQASLNYYRDPNPQSISGHYGLDDSRQFDQTDISYLEDTTIDSQLTTPAKFSIAHVKASITSGHLVKIIPNYPLDGQRATIEIGNLHELLSNDDEYKELVEFPGPLVKGVTHKKTVIEYCENKIRNAICNREISDVDSYVLLWELLILLLRQNGVVVGTDVAELLMKDRKQEQSGRASVGSNASSAVGEVGGSLGDTNASSTSIVKDEAITNKFREFLIYGSGKEALEWAMKHNLWGHAFFLASKLDKRTYANVMTRFANGIAFNDPLQTLYQLLSGKVPVVCSADEKWGDWKPHLAMILSNTSSRPLTDQKAIATLGDTLLSRGNLYAAQFCYLMAQIGFGCYGDAKAKLILLGANHNKPFLEFAVNEAIHMTEVYEYAYSLNDTSFFIPEFQPYKFVLATRLADRGLLEKALCYLEKVSYSIVQKPSWVLLSLVNQVCQLADRLKYCDPMEDSFEGDLDSSRPDNSWLRDLKAIEEDYNKGLIKQDSGESLHAEDLQESIQGTYEQYPGEQENLQANYAEQPQYQSQPWQNIQHQQAAEYVNSHGHLDVADVGQYQEPVQTYWQNQQPQWTEPISTETNDPQVLQDHQQNDYWNNANAQQEEVEKLPDEVPLAPQISLPNQTAHQTSDENDETSGSTPRQDTASKNKSQPTQPSSGWFTKIFNVVSFKPKNQMHLPDDTNPAIVYDEELKKWVNKEGDEGATKAKLLPPPKMADMMPKIPQLANQTHNQASSNSINSIQASNPLISNHNNVNQYHPHMVPQHQEVIQQPLGGVSQQPQHPLSASTPNEDLGLPTRSNQPNMFKLDKSRNLKKSYVDILNPGARSNNPTSFTAPDSFGLPPTNGAQVNYFVPQPVNDPNAPMDFLSHAPTQMHNSDNSQQMSRWSSASSLSREVQFYMQPKSVRS